jgi:hypothetical protein
VTVTALVQTDPTAAFDCSSQPPTSGCCDNRLNPPTPLSIVMMRLAPDALASAAEAAMPFTVAVTGFSFATLRTRAAVAKAPTAGALQVEDDRVDLRVRRGCFAASSAAGGRTHSDRPRQLRN